MRHFKGKRVLITGGASGIGKIMGRLVLEKGAELIIWDINKENMEETVCEFSTLGKVKTYHVDVSDAIQVHTTAVRVKKECGPVDVLINNAGIVVGKYFHEHTIPEISRTMDVNAVAPMTVTRAFLPEMMERNSGYICNIASSAGLVSNPKMSVYVASKWSLTGWSDSLRLEMKQMKKNIGVTTVTPYYIDTGMFDGVRSRIPLLKPEKAAKKIIRAIEKNRVIQSMPWSYHFVRISQGVLPIPVFDWFTGKVLGVYKTMEHFKGR